MGLLARRNLFHDRVRFTVTLTGIVFALVLIIIQFGLFLGFTTTTSNNIDHSNADLWVVFHGVAYFDTGRNFSDSKWRANAGTWRSASVDAGLKGGSGQCQERSGATAGARRPRCDFTGRSGALRCDGGGAWNTQILGPGDSCGAHSGEKERSDG